MLNFKKFRIITIFDDAERASGTSLFVFAPQANHGNIFETLDAHGYDPDGRHNESNYDCSGLQCCSRIHIMDGRKATVASQRFYNDI